MDRFPWEVKAPPSSLGLNHVIVVPWEDVLWPRIEGYLIPVFVLAFTDLWGDSVRMIRWIGFYSFGLFILLSIGWVLYTYRVSDVD